MRKFYNFIKNEANGTRILRLDGPIDEDDWWGDEVTPDNFREELNAGEGDIEVWIDSPGGNVFAAAKIYNMLKDYKGKVTVKIDSLAASAATVVAMAGDSVLVSPVAMFMIHNPMTIAMGNEKDMQEAINVLRAVKDSIVNAYVAKTGKSAKAIAKLMDGETGEGTWMDAKKAVANGFADGILFEDEDEDGDEDEKERNPFAPSEDPDEPENPDEPEDPDEDGDDDEKIRTAHARAKKAYADYISAAKASAHIGFTFTNNAASAETDDGVESEKVSDGEPAVEEKTDSLPEASAEPLPENDAEDSKPTETDEQPSDKVFMPKPTFDENGMTSEGKMSYNILVDKLENLR